MRSGDSVRAAIVLAALFACPVESLAETTIRLSALEQPASSAQSEAFAGSALAVALARSLEGAASDPDAIREIYAVYADRGGEAIWLSDGGAKARALVAALAGADAHALPVARYAAESLSQRVAGAGSLSEAERATLEADLTATFTRYARDVSTGLLEPSRIDEDIDVYPQRAPAAGLLREAAMTDDVAPLLDRLPPKDPAYAALKQALSDARAIDPNAWGPEVPAGATLKYGMYDERVPTLRARLAALGFAPVPAQAGAAVEPQRVDSAVEDAVKRFQADRGLVDDGVVGGRTLAALNQSPRERVAQIGVNMERLRWHNRDLGWRHILVNQAAFEMTLFENGAPLLESRVVIGQSPKHKTAEFSDEMQYLVFNPYWNVPKSIANEEILPILRKDPGYLARNNMTATPWSGYTPPPPPVHAEQVSMAPQAGQVLAQRDLDAPYNPDAVQVTDAPAPVEPAPGPAPQAYNPWRNYSSRYFPYTLRQNPGEGNALGDVKFLFPNHHSIYMHDTPSKKLFLRERRDFSHGCIRLQKPMELAEILLSWQTEDPDEVMRKMLAYDTEKWITLRETVPVHLVYRTARLNANGSLDFLPDVYGRDVEVAAALESEGVSLR